MLTCRLVVVVVVVGVGVVVVAVLFVLVVVVVVWRGLQLAAHTNLHFQTKTIEDRPLKNHLPASFSHGPRSRHQGCKI